VGITLSQSIIGSKHVTPSKIMTQGEEELFCSITENELGIFLSDEAAKNKGWKGRIIPGPLIFSVSNGLMEASGILDDVVAFLGTDEMRFVAPGSIGDTIHVEIELVEKRLTKSGDRGVVRYKWRTITQNGKDIARGINSYMFKVGDLEK